MSKILGQDFLFESTVDATDLASAITLLNSMKDLMNKNSVKYNEKLLTERQEAKGELDA